MRGFGYCCDWAPAAPGSCEMHNNSMHFLVWVMLWWGADDSRIMRNVYSIACISWFAVQGRWRPQNDSKHTESQTYPGMWGAQNPGKCIDFLTFLMISLLEWGVWRAQNHRKCMDVGSPESMKMPRSQHFSRFLLWNGECGEPRIIENAKIS